jgi:hypothetical protein
MSFLEILLCFLSTFHSHNSISFLFFFNFTIIFLLWQADHGTIDYLVHSLANGPEVTKPLLETTRAGNDIFLATTPFPPS